MLLEGRGVRRDPPRAFAWFRQAAEAGDAEACNMVGRCFEEGWGVAPDPAQAFGWYARAAAAGLAWAQYNLGHLHLNGRGAPRDAAAALDCYRRAAAQGHARAMNLVGRCLEHGWGARADPSQARGWYRRSAEAGYFRGLYNHASVLAADGRLGQAADAVRAALECAPAASRGLMARALAASPHRRLRRIGRRALASQDLAG